MEKLEFTKQEFEKQVLPHFFGNYDQIQLYDFKQNNHLYIVQKYKKITDEFIKSIENCHNLSEFFSTIKPDKLLSIDQKICGFTICYKKNYLPIDLFSLDLQHKIELIKKIKHEISNLLDYGILYLNINSKKIMYDGKNILLCSISSFDFKNTKTGIISEQDLNKMKEQFNLFTISYLNNIPIEEVRSKLEIVLDQWFNLKENEQLIGITDSEKGISIGYDLLYSNKQESLIIDKLTKEKILTL